MGATDHQERIAGLTPEKRALLQRRLSSKGVSGGAQTIRRRTESDPSVLSFTQQQMWFLDQLQPGTATYNVPFFMRLRGALNVEALQKAIDAVIARHHVLRTVFAAPQGTPIPVLLKKWQPPLKYADLRSLPEQAREPEARRLLEQEAARPFNFARDLMLRTMLVQLANEEFFFLHLSHHVAWDLRSREVLYHELAHNYAAFNAGRSPSLPELPIQYEDYAHWQREWLQAENLEKLVSYWKQQLAGAPPKLELPTDRPRPPVQSLRGAKIPASFPADLA
ncbi:MAG: hypothetical protein HY043_17365, partial [Verrucomicrobia bacterium]|nr:hypothetical protein [Verrucomicrobiota bacterium]